MMVSTSLGRAGADPIDVRRDDLQKRSSKSLWENPIAKSSANSSTHLLVGPEINELVLSIVVDKVLHAVVHDEVEKRVSECLRRKIRAVTIDSKPETKKLLNLDGFARGEEAALGVDGGRVDQHHSFGATLRTIAMTTNLAPSRWRAVAGTGDKYLRDVFVLELLSKGKAVRLVELARTLEHVLIPVRGRDNAQALGGGGKNV